MYMITNSNRNLYVFFFYFPVFLLKSSLKIVALHLFFLFRIYIRFQLWDLIFWFSRATITVNSVRRFCFTLSRYLDKVKQNQIQLLYHGLKVLIQARISLCAGSINERRMNISDVVSFHYIGKPFFETLWVITY